MAVSALCAAVVAARGALGPMRTLY
eukprot:COSAG01_NODE_68556_length_263_cov_8.493902_1_plen_24_part_01